jgi:chemotaxis protein CheX
MDYRYINPFISSAISIIKESTGVDVRRKRVYLHKGKESIGGVGIMLGITGDIKGKVVYEFSRGMTMRLASKMIRQSEINFDNKQEFLSLLESAILELGNMISGKALGLLLNNDYNCSITPPDFWYGKDVSLIPFYLLTIVIELATPYGDFAINLSIQKKKEVLVA